MEWSRRGADAVTGNTDLVEGAKAALQSDGSYQLPIRAEPFLNSVLESVSTARRVFSHEVDMEWMLGNDGVVWVLQVRPITGLRWRHAPTKAVAEFVRPARLDGVPLSGGSVFGSVVKLDAEAKAPQGGVVVAHSLRLDQLWLLEEAEGLVVTDPSILSHVAIRARELGIPAVGGIRSVATELEDSAAIEVDGTSGVVRVESEYGLLNAQPSRNFFDPWEMVYVDHDGVRFVLDMTDPLWVYSERPLQENHRSRVKGALALLGIERDLQFDERTAWLPGDNSPSIIFEQWSRWQQVRQHPRAGEYLREAIEACADLNSARLNRLTSKITDLATRSFQSSISGVERVEGGEGFRAITAVSDMADTRLLHGLLLGTAIVDILAARAIGRGSSDAVGLEDFVSVVSEIKNRALVGRDSSGREVREYVLVERMYDTPSLMQHAVHYQW